MRAGGKGDAQRPLGIPMEEFDAKWDEIFKKDKEKDSGINVTLNIEDGETTATVTKTWSF